MATVCLGYRRIAYDWLCASWKTSIDQYYAKPTFKFLMSLGRKMDRSCHSEVWLFHASTPAHKSFYWLLSKLSATVNLHSSTTPPAVQPWLPAIRNLKYRLRGTWFIDDESLKIAVEAWFESQDGEFYFQGIKNSWEKSWKKCIDVAGEYVASWQCVCVIQDVNFYCQVAKLLDRHSCVSMSSDNLLPILSHNPSRLALVWGWRPPGAQSAFIKWTGWTLAMTLAWWQHHKHCRSCYYCYYIY